MDKIDKEFATVTTLLEQALKGVNSLGRQTQDHIRTECDEHGGWLFDAFEKHWLEPLLTDFGYNPKAFSVDVGETEEETIRAEGNMLKDALREAVIAGDDPTDQDMLLRAAAPVLCVPKFAPFLPLEDNGHRFLAARDGLWIEVRRPWLHLVYPLARQKAVAMPFGELSISIKLEFDKTDQYEFIRDMASRGRDCLPRERGNWVSWQAPRGDAPGRLVWSAPVDTVGEPASMDYRRPEFAEGEWPCIDIHTHGLFGAGFSSTDDTDDTGDVKIAVVLGNLDRARPTIAARLCCLGLFIPVPVNAADVFGGDQ